MMEYDNYLMETPPNSKTIINGKEVDYFSGCGYFCFHGRKELIEAANNAAIKYGMGCATSRLGYGNNKLLYDVEKNACTFFESESSLYIPAGYLGNTVLLEGLKGSYDIVFIDEESHFSVINAALTTKSKFIYFKHLNTQDLKSKIKRYLKPKMRPLLFCDGIFPITGELSPLHKYIEVLNNIEGSIICVDDAHATGVIGEKGKGTYEYFKMVPGGNVQLYLSGTLSKALGGYGGIIYGTKRLIDRLRKNSSTLNSTIPVSNPAAAATARALDILYKMPDMRKKLWENVEYIKTEFKKNGLEINDTPVPIVCIHTCKKTDLKQIQYDLFHKRNIAVTFVDKGRYTGVPLNGAIRISVFSEHTKEQIDKLVYELIKYLVTTQLFNFENQDKSVYRS